MEPLHAGSLWARMLEMIEQEQEDMSLLGTVPALNASALGAGVEPSALTRVAMQWALMPGAPHTSGTDREASAFMAGFKLGAKVARERAEVAS